jgi:hypothetical protein
MIPTSTMLIENKLYPRPLLIVIAQSNFHETRWIYAFIHLSEIRFQTDGDIMFVRYRSSLHMVDSGKRFRTRAIDWTYQMLRYCTWIKNVQLGLWLFSPSDRWTPVIQAGPYLGIWHQGATIKNASLYQIQISAGWKRSF